MHLNDWAAVLGLAGVLLADVVRADVSESPEPPRIEPVRYSEDYSYLRDAEASARDALFPWADLKYIPLTGRGDVHLTLGTELRLRYEWLEKSNWGEGPQEDTGYLWTRFLPVVDLHAGENVRVFGQVISAFALGLDSSPSPVDENRLDALQAFLDLRIPLVPAKSAVTFRVGRQLITYGSGRLVDVRYGPNVLQAFDGARAFIEMPEWRLEALLARPADHRPGVLDDGTDPRRSVWSLYGTFAPMGIDLFYIGYMNEEGTFAQGTGRELRHTVAARLFGQSAHWDWNFEIHYQFGRFEAAEISAWSVASDTGYTLRNIPLRPRVALKANSISGDADPGAADLQTFNPLFPRGKYFGELSPIGPANLIHINPTVALSLTDQVYVSANFAAYLRQSIDDGVYALGGTDVLRADHGSDARYIGTQAELLIELQAGRHSSISASYSVFTAGRFIEETGAHEPMHFVALEAMYRF